MTKVSIAMMPFLVVTAAFVGAAGNAKSFTGGGGDGQVLPHLAVRSSPKNTVRPDESVSLSSSSMLDAGCG